MMTIDDFVSIPVSPALAAAFSQRYPHGFASVIEQVAWDFLERTEEDFQGMEPQGAYQWDSVRLVDGSQIRTKYFGEYKVATIEGGRIAYDGMTYPSMSQLASAMRGGTSNNAWVQLEVKRPGDKEWRQANLLRK